MPTCDVFVIKFCLFSDYVNYCSYFYYFPLFFFIWKTKRASDGLLTFLAVFGRSLRRYFRLTWEGNSGTDSISACDFAFSGNCDKVSLSGHILVWERNSWIDADSFADLSSIWIWFLWFFLRWPFYLLLKLLHWMHFFRWLFFSGFMISFSRDFLIFEQSYCTENATFNGICFSALFNTDATQALVYMAFDFLGMVLRAPFLKIF